MVLKIYIYIFLRKQRVSYSLLRRSPKEPRQLLKIKEKIAFWTIIGGKNLGTVTQVLFFKFSF